MKRLVYKLKVFLSKFAAFFRRSDGFGINELIGIAAAVILAAFIIIPRLTAFGKAIMDSMDEWWDNMEEKVFSTEPPH